jgi:hypothetical protein
MIRKFDVRFHVRYECGRRLVVCRFPTCSEKFPESERENHEKYECDAILNRQEVIDKVRCLSER